MSKKKFNSGDKFILEIGEKRMALDEYEIVGTDLWVWGSLLEKLTPYELDHSADVSKKVSDDLISRQAAIDAADRADYTGLAVEDVKKVTDEVVKELKQLQPAQPEHDDEVTFWEKRANEYEAMLGELMIKIAKGMTVDSIVINKDGIVFKESQPEIAETYICTSATSLTKMDINMKLYIQAI